MTAATLFAWGVGILTLGWLWFYIVRPMLEDFGWIVNDNADSVPDNMSSADEGTSVSLRPSLETGKQTDRQTEQQPRIKAEQFLTVFRVMRAHGVGREEAAAAFKSAGLPFNNNVWRDAEPPAKSVAADDDDVLVTPYAGRRTRASYYPEEPELEYQSP